MQLFNVNTSDLVKWTNELEKIHKSTMPVVVRGSLNDVAFFMKKKELQKAFDNQFIIRKKNFIRSHTAVNKCSNTFDLNKMVSEVGVIANKDSADGLKSQELGKKARKTKHIPFINKGKTPARISGSHEKQVSKSKRLSNIKKIIQVRDTPTSAYKSNKFRRTAFRGGKGTYINYNGTIGIIKRIKSRPLFIKFDRLYSTSKEKSVKLEKSPFLAPAGEKAFKHMPKFFKQRALKKIKPKI